MAAEIVLATLVLLSVGFLTALEPARQVASREGIGVESGLTFEEVSEGAHMTLEIDPGQVGPNSVGISLRDRSGDPIVNATDVRVRLSYLDADFGETPYSATEVGEGKFVLDEQLISIAGAWQAELVAQRPDAFDARAAFRFEVTGGGGGSLAIAPEADTGRTLLGIEFVILGFLFMGVSIPIGGWYSRSGAAAMVVGAVVVIAGGALLFGTLGAGEELPARNPIPPTQESVATRPTTVRPKLSAVSRRSEAWATAPPVRDWSRLRQTSLSMSRCTLTGHCSSSSTRASSVQRWRRWVISCPRTRYGISSTTSRR